MKKHTIETFSFANDERVEYPQIYADRQGDIVKFGEDNQLPNHLIDYYTNSSLNRAMIQKKKQFFIGHGLSFETETKSKDKKTQAFLDSINESESMIELWGQIGLDLFLFGGSYLQIIWSKSKKQIAQIKHMPFQQMRSGSGNEYNNVEKFYYNSNFEKNGTTKYINKRDFIEFDAFNTEKNKGAPQILFIKTEEPSNIYYPMPDYISALVDLDTDKEISRFHNSAIYNGLNPGMMVIFTGTKPSKQERTELHNSINDTYGGSDNANKFIMVYTDGDEPPIYQQLDVSDADKKFEVLQRSINNSIISAHQMPRALANLESSQSLAGNTKELLEASNVFLQNYIIPHQNFVLTTLNKIMKINNLNEIQVINPNINLHTYSVKDLMGILTINELRDLLGYEAIEEELEPEVEEENVEVTQEDEEQKKLD